MAATAKPVRKVLKKMAHEKGREYAKEYKKDLKEHLSKGLKHNLSSKKSSEKKMDKLSAKYRQLGATKYHPGTDEEIPKTSAQIKGREKVGNMISKLRKHSKEDLHKAHAHMKAHGG